MAKSSHIHGNTSGVCQIGRQFQPCDCCQYRNVELTDDILAVIVLTPFNPSQKDHRTSSANRHKKMPFLFSLNNIYWFPNMQKHIQMGFKKEKKKKKENNDISYIKC